MARPAARAGGGGWQPPTPEELQSRMPQYEVHALLGRGGMGAVYKGWQTSLDRPVAIKILPRQLDDGGEANFAARFKQEARTMAKLSHPGIVPVFDAGETADGLLYFVMEFVEGTDVAQMIKAQGRLQPMHALAITAHVCDALAYAHEHDVIHRDIKPANIMLNLEGVVKVADFGLAKATTQPGGGLTRTDMAMGTPDFIAPEALVAGVPVDHRADLYAVGVMLYQMLTGKVPRGMVDPPSVRVQGVDRRFDAIVSKAMKEEREQRYSSAREIRRDLDVILTTPAAVEPPARGTPARQKPVMRGPGSPGPASFRTRSPAALASLPAAAPSRKSRNAFLGIAAVVALGAAALFLARKGPGPLATARAPEGPAWNPRISRQVADRALRLGASTIMWEQNGERARGNSSPLGDFRLVSISFNDNARTHELKPAEILSLLGASELEGLTLHGARIGLDAEVCARIGKLRNLKGLMLQQTNIEDGWLGPFAELRQLERLNLAMTRVSNAGVAKLAGLRKVQSLDLNGTAATADAVARMECVGALRTLTIAGGKESTEAELGPLFRAAGSLEEIYLAATGPALAEAGRLRNLKVMVLKSTITAEHFRNLATAPVLEDLSLTDCKVSDDAWALLHSLKALRRLKLTRTPRSPALDAVLPRFDPPLTVEVTAESDAESSGSAPEHSGSSAPAIQTFGGHRYQIFLERVTWPEARARAEGLGGHLAAFSDDAEQEWILGEFLGSARPTNQSLWIGGFADQGSRDFRWITDEPVGQIRWHTGHPLWRSDPNSAVGRKVGLMFAAGLALGNPGSDGNRVLIQPATIPRDGFIVEWDDAGAALRGRPGSP